ncbi:MAG: hypothetical protein ACE5FA_11895 [Dehalococcoidia bacterium]
MTVGQTTPALRAKGTILPYRAVKSDGTNDNACVVAAAATDIVLGVTDGSNKAFDSANHAESGDEVRLQPGDILTIEAGEAVTVGDDIVPGTAGVAMVAATTGTVNEFILGTAIEAASASTKLFRFRWNPHHSRVALV